MKGRASLRRYGLALGAAVVAVLLLVALIMAGNAGAVNGYQNGLADRVAGASADHVAQTQSVRIPIRLWHDANGDLWVATPFYEWNITGGKNITILDSAAKYEWHFDGPAMSERLIDALFLFPQPGTPITSRVVFALPDEASVYLEHITPDGTEGLELSFRATDGLIRITHRWQGEDIPTDISMLRPALATVDKRLPLEMAGTLSAHETALLSNDYDYFMRFDPNTRQGYAMLLRQEAPKLSPGLEPSCLRQPYVPTLTAYDPCQFPAFFLPGHVVGSRYLFFYRAEPTAPLQPIENLVARLQLALPDLNAASIMRTPRYDYNAPKNQPAPGDPVTFVARIANRGSQATGLFAYTWYVDGTPVLNGTYPDLAPGEMITLSLNWTWQSGPHTVRIELDPDNALAEVSEQNNVVEDRTDALAVGFWVEQSVYDWFNLHQAELGLGSVSWDDWAQRQLRIWNQMFADAIHPLTPQGIVDRVRLDKVVVLPDGEWPNCANGPSPEDKTVDLVWGFIAEAVGVSSGHTCGEFNFYLNHPEFQTFEPPLLHEMSHARYLVDLYGLNVYANAVRLSDSMSSMSSVLNVERDIENDGLWPVPAYLAIEGELVICQSKAGSAFTNCARGAEGTTPRSHASGTSVHLAVVRLQDGQGNLVQGSSALPYLGFDDHLYYNRYPDDVMSGGQVYEQHSAFAWNRIAGQRPVCGNYNAPCNIGEYLNDLPEHNVIEVRGADGKPLAGAQVAVYQARTLPIWYGKVFLNAADAVYVTDSQGRADLGAFPFGDGPSIIHGFGHSNAVILLKISAEGETAYRFLEVTEANEAYWAGYQDTAIYRVEIGIGGSSWLEMTPLPQPMSTPFLLAGRQLVIYNDRAYVFGGRNAGDDRLTNVYYSAMNPDGTLGPWTETSPLPGRYYDHAVVRVGDQVYLITGAAGDTAVYHAAINPDGSLGTWASTTSLTPSRQNFAAVAYGNYIYVSGGNSGGTRDFVKFASVKPDGSLNAWVDTTPLPENMEGHTMVAYNGYLYVLAPNRAVYSAPINPGGTVGSWSPTTSMPQTVSGYTTVEYNGYLFLLGGNSRSVYYTSILDNGSLGQWQKATSLPELRSGLWAGAHNGFVYAIGGYDGSSYRDTVYSIAVHALRSCYDFVDPPGVGITDIQAVAGRWGSHSGNVGWNPRFDINQDGVVDVVDVMMVAAAWGDTCRLSVAQNDPNVRVTVQGVSKTDA